MIFFFDNIIDFFELYVIVSVLVFFVGLVGLLVLRHNLIILLMSVELIFFSVILNFSVFSVYLDDAQGQLFALFILTIAAAESGLGLAILIVYYRLRQVISLDLIRLLKG
jgi:NADH:ubiquinone oxidoreductase subunit K